jgi:hypothetical protein
LHQGSFETGLSRFRAEGMIDHLCGLATLGTGAGEVPPISKLSLRR